MTAFARHSQGRHVNITMLILRQLEGTLIKLVSKISHLQLVWIRLKVYSLDES